MGEFTDMCEVVDIQTEREKKQPHLSGEARCMLCQHKWIAVKPIYDNLFLECPECHSMKGFMVYPCEPSDGFLWTCNCGNDLFRITNKGTLCANCGQYQQLV